MVVRVARNEPCKFLRATYVLTYATSHLPLRHICLYTPTMRFNIFTALRVYPPLRARRGRVAAAAIARTACSSRAQRPCTALLWLP